MRAPTPSTRVVGSTDMGNVSYVVPSIHPMIQVAPPGVPIHTPGVRRLRRGPRGRPGGDRRGQGAGVDGRRPVARRRPRRRGPRRVGGLGGRRAARTATGRDGSVGAASGHHHREPRRPARTIWLPMTVYVSEEFTPAEADVLRRYFTQPRRPGLRAGQPARGREGRPVRPLLALAQEPAPAVPRRVRGRPRHRRRRHRSTPPSACSGPRSSTTGSSSSTATTRWPSSAASTWPASRPRTC